MNRIVILLIVITIVALRIAPHWSITIGIMFSLLFPLPAEIQKQAKSISARVLQLSIVLLGASLNFYAVINQGLSDIALTFFSITLVILTGHLLAHLFKIESPLSQLISVGTAICGGSAIGAIGPIIKSDSLSMAVALGIVFILNAVSVFTFPQVGYFFGLSEFQFGTWAALAIHDTSAVVASAQMYGEKALETATTLKLTRALWILPLSLGFTLIKRSDNKFSFPWFILFFLLNSFIFSFFSEIQFLAPTLKLMSKFGFSITLFLIGISISKQQLSTIKFKTILFGISLWLITLIASLVYVKNYLL